MRRRLVHTFSLLLIAAVLVAVLAMGAVAAWNLSAGFSAYLQSRDVERLERFADHVAFEAAAAGGADAMASLDLHGLLRGFARREGLAAARGVGPDAARDEPPGPPPGPPGPPGWPPGPPPRQGPPPGPWAGPPGGPLPGGPPPAVRPPPPRAEDFGARVWIVDAAQQPLLGRPLADHGFAERPVRIAGSTVARVRMRPAPPVPDVVERDFLRRQYGGILGVAAVLLMLALACGWWVARWLARPLQAVQAAAARIAGGESGVRAAEAVPDAARRTDEIGDVVRDIDAMAASLERLEDARRRWLADLSHELRTPLSVLRGEIEALADGIRPLGPAALASLREEVLRLSQRVDDLHLLALSDLRALPCHFAPADAAALLDAAAERQRSRATLAGLQITVQTVAAPCPVRWDATRIDQLLGILLDNSLRHTDAPGHIHLALSATATAVRLSVDDSAPGVPAPDLRRVFEPLWRADAARTRGAGAGGSGLGLAIARALAHSHGGRIEAQASPLGGLRVCVTLPRDAQAAMTPGAPR